MDFNSEQIYAIIEKLTGKIKPVGESNEDRNRLKNLETFIEVFQRMHIEIDDIAYRYSESPYASEKAIGEKASKHIDSMDICDGKCAKANCG